jgi:hypothetical protein
MAYVAPSLLLFKGGQVAEQSVGATSKDAVVKMMKSTSKPTCAAELAVWRQGGSDGRAPPVYCTAGFPPQFRTTSNKVLGPRREADADALAVVSRPIACCF